MTDIDLNSEEVKKRVDGLRDAIDYFNVGIGSNYRFLVSVIDAQKKRIEALEGFVRVSYLEGHQDRAVKDGNGFCAERAEENWLESEIKKEAGL